MEIDLPEIRKLYREAKRRLLGASGLRWQLKHVPDNPRISPKSQRSPMLRVLRDSNMACEQKRFANLYKEVVEALNG